MTPERTVVALLTSWLDYWAWPETWTGELQRRSTTGGPAPSRRVTCGTCEGRGKTRSGWMCQECKGRGRYAIDDYTLEPVDTLATPFRELLARFVNCDQCGGWGRMSAYADERPDARTYPLCDGCNGTGKVQAPFSGVCRPFRGSDQTEERIGDSRLDGMARQHERRDLQPAYVVMADLLATMKREDRVAHFMVCWVYVLGGQTVESLPASGLVVLERGVGWLASRWPCGERLPGEVYAAEVNREQSLVRARGKAADRLARGRRDESIRRRYASGHYTQGELARHFQITDRQVRTIVNGRKP